ncbi:hypothetical protein [Crocosphaera chwakensis]|uniref:Uncharacterized protein n=1 Tax=Crocosphaera chwakensis CCY0110 TaxID=391612 RepID=A3ITJ6_9CHRO|nr:hypothetical protein [Crocosphaera chwakensis]EAZ90177.1 hypothetical protein CY0110_30543 [Crocosphaera chwakensis CCY0110]
MKEQIDQTLSLVKSGNYQQAKISFSTARKTWFTFGGTIKRIAPDLYEIMNPGFNQANTLLNQSNPQKQGLIEQLQTLSNTGTNAVKVSDIKE